MRTLASLLILLTISFSVQANEFEYEEVFTCGPKELDEYITYKSLGMSRYEYFFVNTARDGKFVILNNDIQYTNFRDTVISNLYQQNGGTFRASMKEIDGVAVYRLVNKETDWVKTFNVSLESMTYVSRVTMGGTKYEPSIGVCWENKL